MLALRWTEINRLYWLQVIGEEAVGFNKRRVLANQCTYICRRTNMTSLFSEWWPRTAHTAIIHQTLPSSFLPLPFPYAPQMFFLFLNIHFFFSPPLSPSITGLFMRTISSHFFLPSSSILLILLTMSAFPHLLSLWCFPSAVSMRLLHPHHSHYSQSTFAVLL